jgi:hypothetical protein
VWDATDKGNNAFAGEPTLLENTYLKKSNGESLDDNSPFFDGATDKWYK